MYGSQPKLSNLLQCSACDEGFYCPHPGLNSSFAKCHAGFYCSEGSHTAQPTKESFGDGCPAGSYCPQGSSKPLLCETGLNLCVHCQLAILIQQIKTQLNCFMKLLPHHPVDDVPPKIHCLQAHTIQILIVLTIPHV